MAKKFPMKNVHPSWRPIIEKALAGMDQDYLQTLLSDDHWLPGQDKIFSAFSLPLEKTRYILFGESPYPRAASANGYAFWDAAVKTLWSETGLSGSVNRATSLRNMIKMLLLTRGDLNKSDLSQSAIAALDKTSYVTTGAEFFGNFLKNGFLLLNATLVFHSAKQVKEDAKHWHKFMDSLLQQIPPSSVELVLLGGIAKQVKSLPSASHFKYFIAEHPYNLSFITNPQVQGFFRPFDLLSAP